MAHIAHEDTPAVTSRRPRVKWSIDETHQLLDLLIAKREMMGSAQTFSDILLNQVATQLGTDKTGLNIKYRLRGLKRIYKAILNYTRDCEHAEWSETCGANIDPASPAAAEAWDNYVKQSRDGKELVHYQDQAWPYYVQMVMLYAGQSGAAGADADGGILPDEEDDEEEEVLDDGENTLFTESALSDDTTLLSQPCDQLSMDQLLDIAKNMGSISPPIQMAAVFEAVNLVNQIRTSKSLSSVAGSESSRAPSASRFVSSLQTASGSTRALSSSGEESGPKTSLSGRGSSCLLPPSTRTSVSGVPLGSLRGKGYRSDRASSIIAPASRAPTPSVHQSNASGGRLVTQVESTMASAVALTAMTGAINKLSDDVRAVFKFDDVLSPAPLPTIDTPAPSSLSFPPPPSPTPAAESWKDRAFKYLDVDFQMGHHMRGPLSLAFVTDESLCEAYARLLDYGGRMGVVMDWYARTHPNVPTVASQPPWPAPYQIPAPLAAAPFPFFSDSTAAASVAYPNRSAGSSSYSNTAGSSSYSNTAGSSSYSNAAGSSSYSNAASTSSYPGLTREQPSHLDFAGGSAPPINVSDDQVMGDSVMNPDYVYNTSFYDSH